MNRVEPEGSRPSSEPSGSNQWKKTIKQIQRKGVVEVDSSHKKYSMLNIIKLGIKEIIENHPDLEAKITFSSKDIEHTVEKSIKLENGQEVRFKSYASSVFAAVRRATGLSESDYLASLAPSSLPYMEFMSNSKSGQDFFLSNDMQYLLKTDRKNCISYFLSNLRKYLHHFQTFPHSLIVKYLGLYSIKIPWKRKKYFLVMQSIFYPSENIEKRFDVKGCLLGRYQEPPPEGSDDIVILKDVNFTDEILELDLHGDWFIHQLQADADFLKSLHVQDYSFLVGWRKLGVDEDKSSLPHMVRRIQKSYKNINSSTLQSKNNNEASHSKDGVNLVNFKYNGLNDTSTEMSESVAEIPRTSSILSTSKFLLSFIDDAYLQQVQAENRRLLPNIKNALHIVDGPNYRYFMGIIDILARYEMRQRLGRLWKNIKYRCGDHSTTPPEPYAERFAKFISHRVR